MKAKFRFAPLNAWIVGFALGTGCLAAADMEIVSKWMATETASVAKGGEGSGTGKSAMRWAPGVFTLEIGTDAIETTLTFSGRPPVKKTAGYTVLSRLADVVTLAVADPKNATIPKSTEITRDDKGLVMKDGTSVTKLIPYDPAAVATEQQRQEEAKRPTDPLKDQPLSGRLGGADWVAVDGTANRLTVTFVRRKASTNPGLLYAAEGAGDLAAGSWSSIAGTPTVTSIDAIWERVTFTDTETVGSSPKRFLRVRVIGQQS